MGSTSTLDTIAGILNSNLVGIVVGGIVTAWFGFWLYKKQRTSETINKHYFQDGVVGFTDYINSIRVATEENYTNALLITKYFRDLNGESFEEWYQNFLKTYKPPLVSPTMPPSFFRVGFILDSDYFQTLCIEIFITASKNNEYLVSEVPRQIRGYQANPTSMPKDIFVDKLEERVKTLFQEVSGSKIYNVVDALNEILYRLNEINVTSLARLKTVKNDVKIKNALKQLEEAKAGKV